jgi:pyruvate/2-oxoglutarate dehydrogenase complex dihydrolipoamide acyltransferase (E2) component
MRQTINLPVLGDTTKFGVITQWLIAVGERVDEGQPFVAVESDKALVEVPSPVSGVLVEQLAAIDDELAIGAPIAVIDAED